MLGWRGACREGKWLVRRGGTCWKGVELVERERGLLQAAFKSRREWVEFLCASFIESGCLCKE